MCLTSLKINLSSLFARVARPCNSNKLIDRTGVSTINLHRRIAIAFMSSSQGLWLSLSLSLDPTIKMRGKGLVALDHFLLDLVSSELVPTWVCLKKPLRFDCSVRLCRWFKFVATAGNGPCGERVIWQGKNCELIGIR